MCEKASPPPHLPDEDKFTELHRELMAESRWRRDQEARLLTLFVGAFTVFTGGALAVLSKGAQNLHLPVMIMAGFATILTAIIVCLKIRSENQIYKKIGEEVVWIWDHWRFIPPLGSPSAHPLPPEARKFGTGGGAGLSIGFVAVLSLVLLVFVASQIFDCGLKADPNQSVETTPVSAPH